MTRRVRVLVPAVALLLASAACTGEGDGGRDGGASGGDATFECVRDADCEAGERCTAGRCEPRTGCVRDADCPGGRCDLLTGQCTTAPDGGTPDGGAGDGGEIVCTPGRRTCDAEATAVETCLADGTGWESEPCAAETPACLLGACVVCAPGTGHCEGEVAQVCDRAGSGFEATDCAAEGGVCVEGACQVCEADAKRCTEDLATLQTCNSTGTAWRNEHCFGGACDPVDLICAARDCVPGSPDACRGDEVVSCNADGEYVPVTDCAAQTRSCVAGACIDPCEAAKERNSYVGCEYWPVILANELDQKFRDDFAVVVSNPHETLTATVEVYRSGSTQPVVTKQVAPGALEVLRLPWNAMTTTDGSGALATKKGAIAYKMVSNLPVSAYQFNPLSSNLPSGCTSSWDCGGDTCETSTGSCEMSDYSYTNDASLLLPAHTFGDASESPASTYLALTVPHQAVSNLGTTNEQPALLAVVATSPGTTQVSITSRGAAAAGGGLPQLSPSDTATVSLQQYEVLQIVSRQHGNARTSLFTFKQWPASDLTGSIVTSDKPIAVWGGALCHYVPYDKQACDHLEQQLFPFKNWGTRYIGSKSQYPNNRTGDFWRIVAAVDGTELTFSPPLPGISNPSTLNRGEKLEFSATVDFLVYSQDYDHPIMVAQFFKGIEVTGTTGGDKSFVGDPTMVLAIPVEQYRDRYTFITPPGIAQDYINVIRPIGAEVTLDDAPVQPVGGWITVYGAGYEVGRIAVSDGAHHLAASLPVGLLVYGYDWSVSYGYPGGLDLKPIITIEPPQ